jgi:hypothetical protein
MIFTSILNLLYLTINLILTPLNNFSPVVLSSNFTTAILNAGGYYNSLNTILPMDTMIQILGVSLAIEGIYFIYKVVMWVIKKIPTIN